MGWKWDENPPFGFRTENDLFDAFESHYALSLQEVSLKGTLSKARILDVFQAWQEDLERGKERNFRTDGISPGHVKAAAFLTYWLRREAPIVDLASIEGQYDNVSQLCIECDIEIDASLKPVSAETLSEVKLPNGMTLASLLENRQRVFAYGNELFALTFGLQLAKRFEEQNLKEQGINEKIKMPPLDFVEDACYLFKFKSVSPHAIDLMFRALLMVRAPA